MASTELRHERPPWQADRPPPETPAPWRPGAGNRRHPHAADRASPAALLRRFGHTALSFHSLNESMRHWMHRDGCVAYTEVKGAWIAVANPLVPPEREQGAMVAFIEAAARAGKRARFFGVEGPRQSEDGPLCFLKVGEQPFWNPQQWPAGIGKKLRGQIRRAKQNRVVTVRLVAPQELRDPNSPIRDGLDALIDSWLRCRGMAPMGFVVGLHPYDRIEERRLFVAQRGTDVVGALIAAPIYARNGWFLDSMLRAPGAPNGTVELLFDLAMGTLAAEGSEYVTFGVCPLMNVNLPMLRVARTWGSRFYNFAGLQRFKAKLAPTAWSPVYVVHSTADHPLLSLADAFRAFLPHGIRRFLWDTAHQRVPSALRWPAIAQCVAALGWLLVSVLHPIPMDAFWGIPLAAATALFGAVVLWLSRDFRPRLAGSAASLGSLAGVGWLSSVPRTPVHPSLAVLGGALTLTLAGFLWTAARRRRTAPPSNTPRQTPGHP